MERCKRCERYHSPRLPCGIPPKSTIRSPGVTLGFGAKIGGTGTGSTRFPIHTKSKVTPKMKLTKGGLEEMLAWGLEQEQNCLNLLKILPDTLPEYEEVLTKLDKLQAVTLQIKQQIAARKK